MIELYRTPCERYAPVVINVSQFDYNLNTPNELSFRIKDDNGYYVSMRSFDVWLIAARPDGVIYEIQGMVNHYNPNDYTCADFQMIKGLTDVQGDVICEIVWHTSAKQNATQNFILRVEPSPKEVYGVTNTVIDDSGGGEAPYEPDVPTDEPQYRLKVTTMPTKTTYDEGEALNLTGVKIDMEKYTDSQGVLETTDVTNSCTFNPANGQTLTTGDTTVTVTYVR